MLLKNKIIPIILWTLLGLWVWIIFEGFSDLLRSKNYLFYSQILLFFWWIITWFFWWFLCTYISRDKKYRLPIVISLFLLIWGIFFLVSTNRTDTLSFLSLICLLIWPYLWHKTVYKYPWLKRFIFISILLFCLLFFLTAILIIVNIFLPSPNDEYIEYNNKIYKIPKWNEVDHWFRFWWTREHTIHKPVIYIYPEKKEQIKVFLDFKWVIIADYPQYNQEKKWWEIIAYPDGKIINIDDNKEYSYLFWEGISKPEIDWDMTSGFVIRWDESREFLQNILPKMWLTPKEYNEFIVYWYPLLQKNKYNLIHFAGKQYTDWAELTTLPKTDAMLRVFMVFKALETPIEITPQIIFPFERKGFTVVEWGWIQIY